MEDQIEIFFHLWDDYETSVRGRLYSLAEKNQLTPINSSTVLADAAARWGNDYSAEGRWVSKVEADDAQRGRKIRKILCEDQKFDAEPSSSVGAIPTVVGTFGGAAVGYAVASALDLGSVATAVATVLPMGAGFVGGNYYSNKKRAETRKNLVESYILQLNKYRQGVLDILMA
ncbi:MAG: hypothetical protein K1W14_06945 [Muribaculaceae bacterium]|jgi:hypothetical protein